MLRSHLLEGIPHGFSTRAGLAAENVLPGGVMVRARQVHSPEVVTVTERWDIPPEADALVTDRPGLVLGVVTADCAPVLLADPEAGLIGAAHAGWRGAQGGVIENALDAMEALGARRSRIRAAVGPCIARASYEVDDAFRDRFAAEDDAFFAAGRTGHWQFDLPAYVSARLRAAGVTAIEGLALDTYADPARFHSYRRATHLGQPTGGRQTSAIALPP